MRKFLRVLTPIVASAALALAVVSPAEAATSGGTGATFTLTGGALAITVPSGTADLGTYPASVSTLQASGQLGNVTVDDGRGSITPWTVTAASTDFVSPNNTVPKAQVAYLAGTPTNTTGTVVVVPAASLNLTGVLPAVVGTPVGSNSATWNPTITVAFPLKAVAGTYNGTITHSVS